MKNPHTGLTKKYNAKVLAEYDLAEKTNDENVRREIWDWLGRFPLDRKGRPTATSPTALGNILAGYEAYPLIRYGMDSVFYWPRIWLSIDEKTRREIDSQWAPADSLIYLSFTSMVGSIACIGMFVVAFVGQPWGSAPDRDHVQIVWGILASIYLLGWLSFYRLSLPLHVSNGELFKGVFDVFRHNVVNMQITNNLAKQERLSWNTTWRYLQYLKDEQGNHVSQDSGAMANDENEKKRNDM